MPNAVSTSSHHISRPLVIAGAVVGALIGVALVFWTRYGTAVFYEMILAGVAACF